ncbi:MAG: helix-turn-helix domain-containing protein [Caldisericia bacterium]|nr:helix-turn-helix domain-containing protein [Caldisericia bacterium]
MIVESNNLDPELREKLIKEIASLLKTKPELVTLTGVIIQLQQGAFNLNQAEKQVLMQAYVNAAGSISKTALLLGVTRKTVYSLLKKHQIDSLINING